ncbi:uncharacterized protein LOC109863043, partial [Pseudomyrmex gracilis]|uniref:uncharacterized protein LOC109863043 n=1 Tax=Pseudomyrmex gracilis TaxID=219809 RepID=UPI000995BEDE
MEEEDEKDIDREKVKRAIRKMKERKASGIDGIPEEIWKYGEEDIERWVKEFYNPETLNEELEEKKIISHNQTGFRKDMVSIDNIYVINYLMNRQIEKKEGKMVADLKAAFDSVDREVLTRTMKERGVRERIVRRVEQVLRETKSDLEKEMGKVKWGGVRLGGEKICTLAYADDMVILAEEKEGMKSMIDRLEGYLDKKKVELNADKTNM